MLLAGDIGGTKTRLGLFDAASDRPRPLGVRGFATLDYPDFPAMLSAFIAELPAAATDVRTALTRNGGSLADAGSVSYMFARKGVVLVPKGTTSEDDVLLAVLDAGAEEVNDLGEAFEVVSEPGDLVPVRTALQTAGIEYESAESSFVPSVTVPLDEDGARKIFKLIDAIEDSDDVQNVYSNFDVSDDVMALIDA